jgi:hypothetical protein
VGFATPGGVLMGQRRVGVLAMARASVGAEVLVLVVALVGAVVSEGVSAEARAGAEALAQVSEGRQLTLHGGQGMDPVTAPPTAALTR